MIWKHEKNINLKQKNSIFFLNIFKTQKQIKKLA